jgi:hypothetical protein
MRKMTRWIAILVSTIGIAAGAAAENNSSSTPLTNVKESKDKTKSVIDILKSYPVNKIKSGMVDSTKFVYHKLPQIPLEKWLGSITSDSPLEWKENDCAAYDSNVDDNDKHCASFLVTVRTPQWHCPEIYLSFSVETDGTVYFLNDNSGVNDFGAKGSMQQIADLEKTLAEVKAKTTPDRPSSLPAASLKAMSDNDMIMHVRALDVHSLDPSLPSERFDKWFERTARWPLQWGQDSAFNEYNSRCEPKRLLIRVFPVYASDPGNRRPPAFIWVDIGSWERGIEGEPKLNIYFKDSGDDVMGATSTVVKNLSSLQKKFDEWNASLKKSDEWNASLMARKSMMPFLVQAPTYPQGTTPAKAPIKQNMNKIGNYSRIKSTPSGHCYGIELSLWKHDEHVFGTLYDLDGQCADSRAPTYVIRDAKYDPATGMLEFWSYGTPGYKFVGKMDQKMVSGNFVGMYDDEEVKLKRSKDNKEPIPDSDKNVEVWCKDYAPKIRYVVEEELKELCKSLGVQ